MEYSDNQNVQNKQNNNFYDLNNDNKIQTQKIMNFSNNLEELKYNAFDKKNENIVGNINKPNKNIFQKKILIINDGKKNFQENQENHVNQENHISQVNQNNEIITNSEMLILYKEILNDFCELNENTTKSINKIKNNMKKMEKLIVKSVVQKKKIPNDWGFAEQRQVPKTIEVFFNLQANSKISRTAIGKLFQDYISKNNLKGGVGLKNCPDKRIYKMDDNLTKLFGLSSDDKNKINNANSPKIKFPDGFNFYNYQQWIKKLYIDEFGENVVSNKKIEEK